MFDSIQELVTTSPNGLLISIAFKGLWLMLAAWFITGVLRRSAASRRHMVWTIAAFGLLLIPAMTIGLPSLQVSVPEWWPSSEVVQATVVPERERLFVPAESTLR